MTIVSFLRRMVFGVWLFLGIVVIAKLTRYLSPNHEVVADIAAFLLVGLYCVVVGFLYSKGSSTG